jgi:hypothetical protein
LHYRAELRHTGKPPHIAKFDACSSIASCEAFRVVKPFKQVERTSLVIDRCGSEACQPFCRDFAFSRNARLIDSGIECAALQPTLIAS